MYEPKKYSSTRIEDLCSKVTSGGTPSRKKPEFYTGEIPWIKTGELNGWFIYDAVEKITQGAIKGSSAKIYPKNTILMAMYGDGKTIGSTAITAIEAASNQACCAMTVDPNKCIPLFLLYSLQHYRETIVNLALGGAQRNLNQGTIKNFEINHPPLIQQKKIVHVLSSYDNLIENNNRRIAILEEMAQSLYREWFVNFRYPDHEYNLDVDGTPKLIDSPLGRIPVGWEVKKFSDLVNYKTGKLNSNAAVSDGEYPFFTCSRETFRTNTYSFDCESVLLAGNNANAVYPIKYFNGKFDAYQRTYVITEKNRDEIAPSFLFYCLELKLNQLKSLSTGSATRFLTKGILDNLDLIVPSSKLMKKFDHTVLGFLNAQANFKKRNDILKSQRDMLLPKLISGDIEL
ncbi:restriction endonuclease subunit S [Vibrio splendidus]